VRWVVVGLGQEGFGGFDGQPRPALAPSDQGRKQALSTKEGRREEDRKKEEREEEEVEVEVEVEEQTQSGQAGCAVLCCTVLKEEASTRRCATLKRGVEKRSHTDNRLCCKDSTPYFQDSASNSTEAGKGTSHGRRRVGGGYSRKESDLERPIWRAGRED
jgi:hypothetical protein